LKKIVEGKYLVDVHVKFNPLKLVDASMKF